MLGKCRKNNTPNVIVVDLFGSIVCGMVKWVMSLSIPMMAFSNANMKEYTKYYRRTEMSRHQNGNFQRLEYNSLAWC